MRDRGRALVLHTPCSVKGPPSSNRESSVEHFVMPLWPKKDLSSMATGARHVPRVADPTRVRRGLLRMVWRPLGKVSRVLLRRGSAAMAPQRVVGYDRHVSRAVPGRPLLLYVPYPFANEDGASLAWLPRAVLKEGKNPGPSMWLLASLSRSLVHLPPTRGRVRSVGIDSSGPHGVSADYSHHVNVTCEDLSVGMKWLEDMEPYHDLGVARRELTARAIIAAVRPPSRSALRGRLRGRLTRG